MNFSAIKVTVLGLLVFGIACTKSSETEVIPGDVTDALAVYKKIYGATSVTSDGTNVTIKSLGVPDHKSPYYANSNSLYAAFTGTTFGGGDFKKKTNSIVTQAYTFILPLNPKVASNHAATPLGPIGIALKGVAFYNQYAGPNNQVLTSEINSFDNYYGHPQAQGQYHYHVEPLYLTTVKSTKSGLMAF